MKIHKLELKLTSGAMKALKTLKERIDAESYTEVIQRSLRLFNFIETEKEKDPGLKFIIEYSDGRAKQVILL